MLTTKAMLKILKSFLVNMANVFSLILHQVNGYACICPPGQTGKHCDQKIGSFCSSYSCKNGICLEEPDRFVCNCKAGYTGVFCESEINVSKFSTVWRIISICLEPSSNVELFMCRFKCKSVRTKDFVHYH